MTNTISGKEIKEMQNKLFAVLQFDLVTKKRATNYSGLSYKNALDFVLESQALGYFCIIVPDKIIPYDQTSLEFNDYLQYMGMTSQKKMQVELPFLYEKEVPE